MPTRSITNEYQRRKAIEEIEKHSLPFMISTSKGRRRSTEQNRLQRRWMNDISKRWDGMTPENVRGFCKLTFGVPILRAENELFCERYDAILKPLPYEQKLQLMQEPLDLPVTRIMTTGQKTDYLNQIQRHFAEQGIWLAGSANDPPPIV